MIPLKEVICQSNESIVAILCPMHTLADTHFPVNICIYNSYTKHVSVSVIELKIYI